MNCHTNMFCHKLVTSFTFVNALTLTLVITWLKYLIHLFSYILLVLLSSLIRSTCRKHLNVPFLIVNTTVLSALSIPSGSPQFYHTYSSEISLLQHSIYFNPSFASSKPHCFLVCIDCCFSGKQFVRNAISTFQNFILIKIVDLYTGTPCKIC